jgi:hypothetical protein
VKPVQRGQQGPGAVNAYQFSYGMRNYGVLLRRRLARFLQQFRPQILMFMANVAQQSIGEDAFVEQFRSVSRKPKAAPMPSAIC